MMGAISVASDKMETTALMSSSVIYDILMKDDKMVWLFRYTKLEHDFLFNIQAGKISIDMFEDDEFISNTVLTYENNDSSNNNSHIIKG